jgi:hypothetical protein
MENGLQLKKFKGKSIEFEAQEIIGEPWHGRMLAK